MATDVFEVQVSYDDDDEGIYGSYTQRQAERVVAQLKAEVLLSTDANGICHHPRGVWDAQVLPMSRYDDLLTDDERRAARRAVKQATPTTTDRHPDPKENLTMTTNETISPEQVQRAAAKAIAAWLDANTQTGRTASTGTALAAALADAGLLHPGGDVTKRRVFGILEKGGFAVRAVEPDDAEKSSARWYTRQSIESPWRETAQ